MDCALPLRSTVPILVIGVHNIREIRRGATNIFKTSMGKERKQKAGKTSVNFTTKKGCTNRKAYAARGDGASS